MGSRDRRGSSPPPQSEQRPEPSPGRGRALGFLGTLLVVLAGIGLVVAFAESEGHGGIAADMWPLVGISVVVGVTGLLLRQKGRQHLAPSAEAVMAADPRPPVLYLRAFKDDLVNVEEEHLARLFGEIGPVVAVGSPGEALPPLGAARLYVADNEWKRRVSALMKKAALIVVRAGDTEGLTWELGEIASRVWPHKLVFLVPADKRVYEHFRGHAEAALDLKLPDHPTDRGHRVKAGTLSGLICFDDDWTPKLLLFDRAWFRAYDGDAGVRLRQAVRPIFERHGAAWQPAPVSGFRVYQTILLVMVALAIAFYAFLFLTGKLAIP